MRLSLLITALNLLLGLSSATSRNFACLRKHKGGCCERFSEDFDGAYCTYTSVRHNVVDLDTY